MKLKYVVMKLQRWKNMKAFTPAEQSIEGCGKSVGVLLVYDNLEELRADEGADAPYVCVEIVENN